MSNLREERRGRRDGILKAAQEVWIHYGFRRSSMEQIAEAAGISRTGLYHHFPNKEEIFRALSEELQHNALEEAELAARGSEPLVERLYRALDAKSGHFFALLHHTKHGPELIDESSRQCGDVIAEARLRYTDLLARCLRDAARLGELDLDGAEMRAKDAAVFLVDCAEGLKGRGNGTPSPEKYRERLRQLAEMASRAWARA